MSAETAIAVSHRATQLENALRKVIRGKDDVVRLALVSVLARGHLLIEGVPGVGKTTLGQALARAIDCGFQRVQFTSDMLPADVLGISIYSAIEQKFEFKRGPIFTNVLLADEINRTTPKTQSALLEAMEETTVTVGKRTYKLEAPFFVLATQNPLEMEGTYPLPEAQLDRFFMKLKVDFPTVESLHTIMNRTTRVEEPKVSRIVEKDEILDMRKTVRAVPIARPIQDYAIRIMMATHPRPPYANPTTMRYVRYGSSPRGAQAMVIGGKIRALLSNRVHVSCEDIRAIAYGALRHRVLLNFEGEAERVDPDTIVKSILESTPEPK